MRVAGTQVQAVVGVDDPVESTHNLIVRRADGVTLITARIVTISLVQIIENAVHEFLSGTDDIRIRLEVRVGIDASGAAHHLAGTGNYV